jgi:hypothetical protein
MDMMNDRIAARPPYRGLQPLLCSRKAHVEHSPTGTFFHKKGFELQFHWIFILIAGALILAFFFTVANRQRAISQEKLQLTLATDIENIFTGAIVSRGTAQKLPVPPQGIAFECTEGCACQFRIEKAPRDFGDKSLFAPELLEERDINVWALEFKTPYRITNFLYLTNPNIKYYFVHEDKGKTLLQQLTKGIPMLRTEAGLAPFMDYQNITVQELTSLKAEDYQHHKFIFLHTEPPTLDDTFRKQSFSGIKIDDRGVSFYDKEGTKFSKPRKILSYVGIPSLYAAIFSQDSIMYECGLRTAFRKLSHVSQLYAERAAELQQKSADAGRDWCNYGAISTQKTCDNQDNSGVVQALCQQHALAKTLSVNLDQSKIAQLNPIMHQLETQNRNFIQQSCPELF